MSENDKTYNWIRGVIMSCENTTHIEFCEILIDFYVKKKPEAYLIKNLRESLNLKTIMIKSKPEEAEDPEMSPVLKLFLSGEYTVKEVSEKLNIKINICEKIVNEHLKRNTMF